MTLSKSSRILLMGANIWYFGEGMMGPLFAVFAERVGGDILDITWAWSTYLVITGLLYIVVGKLLDRREYKEKAMVLGYLLNALFTFGYLIVSNPLQLFLVQAGLGLAEALGTPSWDALYSKSIREREAYGWGLYTGQSQIVTGIAFAFGGLIVHYISFNVLFITMGFIQLFATATVARLLTRQK